MTGAFRIAFIVWQLLMAVSIAADREGTFPIRFPILSYIRLELVVQRVEEYDTDDTPACMGADRAA